MAHQLTQDEWEAQTAEKVLAFVRDEIYLELRFLELALTALAPCPDRAVKAFATDGDRLFFSPEQVLRVFRTNAPFLDRAYLHTVLHCIFAHLWIGADRERARWQIACDIAVEYTIDAMGKDCTKRILSWTRQQFYERLQKSGEGISAAVIYRMLKEDSAEELQRLAAEFYTDDHCYWPKQEGSRAAQSYSAAQNKWNRIARQTKQLSMRRGDMQKEGEAQVFAQLAAERGRRSYRDFLQKFSVLREELAADLDEFDLNYYTYGFRLYRNMPLIEPLESRETKKIREFVIAIDTSYSTSGELVRQFLRETVDILNQSERFFSDARIRILQSDDAVRQDTVICGQREWASFLADFRLAGGGGTDFRPVFSYVDRLIAKGEIKALSGLLYFTDGKGIYPGKRPDYKTAFLFLGEYDDAAVPPWAMRLRLEPEEFLRDSAYELRRSGAAGSLFDKN